MAKLPILLLSRTESGKSVFQAFCLRESSCYRREFRSQFGLSERVLTKDVLYLLSYMGDHFKSATDVIERRPEGNYLLIGASTILASLSKSEAASRPSYLARKLSIAASLPVKPVVVAKGLGDGEDRRASAAPI